MIDEHYTSSAVASDLLRQLPRDFTATKIVDFAAGEGALLSAARRRFVNAQISYNDLNRDVARSVRVAQPDWIFSTSDFLDDRSSAASAVTRAAPYDLILLNPPFSQRGACPTKVRMGNTVLVASVGLGFVLRALRLLSKGGYLLAVLPLGCFDRVIDQHAWNWIKSNFCVREGKYLDCFAFASARARTRMIRIEWRIAPLIIEIGASDESNGAVVRGSYQMHWKKQKGNSPPQKLVHSTDLKNGAVWFEGKSVRWHKTVDGPAVLLPRVGAPNRDKIAVLPIRISIVPSDCVFAIRCESMRQARTLKRAMIRHWELLEMLYGGTGAPYITRIKLERFIERISDAMSQKNLPNSTKVVEMGHVQLPIAPGRPRGLTAAVR